MRHISVTKRSTIGKKEGQVLVIFGLCLVMYTGTLDVVAADSPTGQDIGPSAPSLRPLRPPLCDDTQRPWLHFVRMFRSAAAFGDSVKFNLESIYYVDDVPRTQSENYECVFRMSGTLQALNVRGSTGFYSFLAAVADNPKKKTSTILTIELDKKNGTR